MSSDLRQKLHKKLKVSMIGKSKRGIKRDDSDETENGGKRYSFSRGKPENRGKEKGNYQPVSSDRRRKRVSAVPDVKANENIKSIRTMWVSNANASNNTRKPKDIVNSVRESRGKLRNSLKSVDKTDVPVKVELKTQVRVKPDSGKHSDRSRVASPRDSESLDDQPKKRKRRIRLDRYDTSNKRLDDSIASNERTKEKPKDLEKDAEMSKNAEFRAIQPSPSILSFVEDNLLGRRRMIELRRAGYNTELPVPLDDVPSSTSSGRANMQESMFKNNKLEFFAAAKIASSFPPPDEPEIAFAGRSNVGKSSLLNALTRQWGTVRTSDKPGHTQSINFFHLGTKRLVDLPGYGFAYAKEEVKEAWEELVKEYVSTRPCLERVCLLIDTKWGMKPRDRELIDLMERYQTKYQIVLTKTDAVFPIDVARRAMQIEENLKKNKSIVQPVMMVSAKTGAGIQSLRTVVAKALRFAKA